MKRKIILLTLVLLLVLAGGAALLLLRQRPLTERCPQLAALPAEEVSVGYWPTSNTSPFYSPLTPGEPHLLDEVVTLSVPADVGGLLSGMFADVTFRTDASENAVVVPTEAILTNGTEQHVFVVENNAARQVAVTTGLTGNGVTEITSGLQPGQQLVTVGQAYLSDGDPVRVVSGEG